jgi:hypothetical protein
MRVEDHYPRGACAVGAAAEKGGKRHRIPGAPQLEAFINEYFAAAGIRNDGIGPLFRPVVGKAGVITEKPTNRVDATA